MSLHSRDLPPPPRGDASVTQDGVQIIIVTIVFLMLATTAVCLRFYARYMRRVQCVIEDYMVLAALILYYGHSAINIMAQYMGGVGRHTTEVPSDALERLLKLVLALQVIYAFEIGLLKISICVLLIRVFFVKPFRIAAKVVMSLCVMWAVMTILIGFLICTPLSYNWNLNTPYGHCGDQNAAYVAIGVVDIVTDMMILALPIPMLWKLQIPVANKIALSSVFGLGLFTIIIGILRVVALVTIDFSDFSYSAKGIFIWSDLEPGIGIVVACGPLLRPLFEKIFPAAAAAIGRHTHTNNKGNHSHDGGPHDTKNFNRLDDGEVPLKPMTGINSSMVTSEGASHKDLESDFKDDAMYGDLESAIGEVSHTRGISVQTQWDVQRN
ncbi:MAG: hypothetical protein M4579_001776 [Chaenotheca gracillima]|nr:MAG: hypothetical protein M4579_001776 [Chaenotheca gracillima]